MTTLTVACAQILSGEDPEQNLAQVAEQTARAAAAGARLVIFPEATMRRFGLPLVPVAETLDGPFAERVRAIAAEHQVTVVVGMFTPSGDGRVHNTLIATGAGVEARYDKIHLFDAFGHAESKTVAPGDEIVTIDVDGVTVGLATCYDIRFPGLFTELADAGAEVICLSVSWGAGPGKLEQWELLARARALDSTCAIVACDQADPASVGIELEGAAPTGIGHSLVVSALGTVLASTGAEPDLLVHTIDVDEVAEARKVLPVLANRRR